MILMASSYFSLSRGVNSDRLVMDSNFLKTLLFAAYGIRSSVSMFFKTYIHLSKSLVHFSGSSILKSGNWRNINLSLSLICRPVDLSAIMASVLNSVSVSSVKFMKAIP